MIRSAGLGLALLAGCPAPHGPSLPLVAPETFEVGRDGLGLRGVAGDGGHAIGALTDGTKTVLVVGGSDRHVELAGAAGPLAAGGGHTFVALGGTGTVAGVALRGQPGAVLATITGDAPAGTLAIDSTEWVVITSLAATPDGVVAGGTFSGTLRIADKVVSSAGSTDGFVARITGGAPAWLVRVGGPNADALQGVAFGGDRIAIAGTFTSGADLLGAPLVPYDERSAYADGFVAELDGKGARRWSQTFGGIADEAVAGVAIDDRGRVAVAGTARATLHVGGADLVAQGAADGMVAWFTADGAIGNATLLGGADFDGLRAIVAVGDRVVVAGFYSGSLRLGDRTLAAAGGDDAFLAEVDDAGRIVTSWPISGEGREEVTALAPIPGGFVAGVTHTAAGRIDEASLAAPHDPMAGAALAIRGR